MHHLELGPVKNPGIIIQTLNDRIIPLKTLKIVNSSLDENTVRIFSSYLNTTTTLKELDISGSSIKDQQLQILLDSLLSNISIEEGGLILSLNRLGLKGKRYEAIKNTLISYSSKISELSLNENGISLSDSIIYDISEFANLKKVSLAVNFTKKMVGIGKALSLFLDHSNITSLNISGNSETGQKIGGYALETEAIPFIKGLYTNSSLKELDISGNLIGDEGIKMICEILREPTSSIQIINIDNNNITSIETINDFLDSAAESSSMIDAVFPVDDIYNILCNSGNQENQSEIELISQKRQIVQKVTMNNRSKAGLNSVLSLLNDKTLDDLVDEATLELQENIELSGVHFEKHSAITDIVGLPLPYEKEGDISTSKSEIIENDAPNATGEDVYASKQLMSTVSEPENESNVMLSSFKTLQFNSLCIRRPDAEQKLEEKGKFLLQDVDMSKLVNPQLFVTDSDDDNNNYNNDNNNNDNDNDSDSDNNNNNNSDNDHNNDKNYNLNSNEESQNNDLLSPSKIPTDF